MSLFADIADGLTVRAVWALQEAAARVSNGSDPHMADDVGASVYAVLQAAGQLSNAQARLSQQPDLSPAERDHAAARVVECFNRFADAAKRAPKPVSVRVTLE